MEHLNSDQLAKLRQGALQGNELLDADDHLATCDECRGKVQSGVVASKSWAELGLSLQASVFAAERHLSFENMQAYVDRNGPQANRMGVESHLLECDDCRAEVEDLKDFARRLRVSRSFGRRYNRYLIFGPIAAALIIGFVLTRPHRSSVPEFAVSLHDGGKIVGLDRQGKVMGPAASDAVVGALRDGRITVNLPDGLRSERSVLLGAETAGTRFHVVEPVGEPVLKDKPQFRWEPLAGARSYKVQVFDADFRAVASSPEIAVTTWTPQQPLTRGKQYAWQVTAIRGGAEVTAPQPPDPEARFAVVSAAEADSIEQGRQSSAGHLELATRFAHAGLCRETLGELDALDLENPGSSLLQKIRKSVSVKCTQPR